MKRKKLKKKVLVIGAIICALLFVTLGYLINKNSNQNAIVLDLNTVEIEDNDSQNFIEEYQLPSLDRMDDSATKEYMLGLQVFKKMEALGVNTDSYFTPEINWKTLNNNVVSDLNENITFKHVKEFKGTTTSELNNFIESHDDTYIKLKNDEILLDEPIKLKSNIGIDGEDVSIESEDGASIEYAVIAEKCSNFMISNLDLTNATYNYGVYVIEGNEFVIEHCTISGSIKKGIVLMGNNEYFSINDNVVTKNENGCLYLDGNIHEGIISDNELSYTAVGDHYTAGITLTGKLIQDYYTADNPWQDLPQIEQLDCPHDLIISSNKIINNNSSGIYSDGGYQLYVLDNEISYNDKEGLCLDFVTFGSYIKGNSIKRNGGRFNQSDDDLTSDGVASWGRLEDGSSPAKIPGISIDNTAYNIIFNNDISENYGSGVKAVRTSFRNIVIKNTISNNNLGENENFSFFGVELASDIGETTLKCMDFTPNYENIIANNVISGSHHSGVYIGGLNYYNSVINNKITDAKYFSILCISELYNEIDGNDVNNEISNSYVDLNATEVIN